MTKEPSRILRSSNRRMNRLHRLRPLTSDHQFQWQAASRLLFLRRSSDRRWLVPTAAAQWHSDFSTSEELGSRVKPDGRNEIRYQETGGSSLRQSGSALWSLLSLRLSFDRPRGCGRYLRGVDPVHDIHIPAVLVAVHLDNIEANLEPDL